MNGWCISWPESGRNGLKLSLLEWTLLRISCPASGIQTHSKLVYWPDCTEAVTRTRLVLVLSVIKIRRTVLLCQYRAHQLEGICDLIDGCLLDWLVRRIWLLYGVLNMFIYFCAIFRIHPMYSSVIMISPQVVTGQCDKHA